jgi:hypothetical protein
MKRRPAQADSNFADAHRQAHCGSDTRNLHRIFVEPALQAYRSPER